MKPEFQTHLTTTSITSQLSDEAIHQIFEIIASEIDDFEPHYIIDDKELSIYLGD